MRSQDQETQVFTKRIGTRGAEKWQQVIWTDESKFETSGCRRKKFENGTTMTAFRQHGSMVKVS